jgi:hypothetical protein
MLRNMPGDNFLASQIRMRMIRDGVPASTALLDLPLGSGRLRNPNALPRELWNAPSLIDFDYWAEVNEMLSRRGCNETFDRR